jgi:hypothetical protein
MRKIHILLFILSVTLAVLITLASVSWYFAATAPTYYGSSWMGQMWGNHLGGSESNWGMGGMMGDGYYGNGYGTTPSYLWIVPVALIGIVVATMIGIGVYLYLPELRYIKPKGACTPNVQSTRDTSMTDNPPTNNLPPPRPPAAVAISNNSNAPNNCEIILKTMTPEEQKVFNVLVAHKGKYLQKYVVKESGLSRLKTHRVVARFAQRGIVTVKEFGNTNEIILSDWVATANPPKSI